MTLHPDAKSVYDFWFVESSKDDWFSGSQAFDVKIRIRFSNTLIAAERGELFTWRNTPQGRLAEIIVLDQFSRQLYRNSARAFASDTVALILAQNAVALGIDGQLTDDEKQFLFMPYMHSESLIVHDEAMKLFSSLSEHSLEFEQKHREVIERFGRFPKRNQALGRTSTKEEIDYIAERGNSMF